MNADMELAPTSVVERPLMIGVLGAHSTGKSTFLARLAHALRCRNLEVATVADLGEQALRMGMPILHHHTWASTLWFITRGISLELEAWLHVDVVLIDRPVPDALGYYRAALAHRQERPDPVETAYLEALVRGHSHRYDLLFRTTLDSTQPVGTGKTRDSDHAFRVLADRHVEAVLHDLALPHDLLPAHGHDKALHRAIGFTTARLTTTATG